MSQGEPTAADGPPGAVGGDLHEAAQPAHRARRITIAVLVALAVVFAALAVISVLLAPQPSGDNESARIGTRDHSYDAPGVHAPTGRKTEAAKLWYQDGTWWGIIFQPSRDAYTINRFDMRSDAWIDTGAVLDDRNGSQADVLWDGTHLYGVSGGSDPADEDDGPVIVRMSYDHLGGTYRMDRGFPVRIAPSGSEMFTLDKDDAGRLWATWTTDQSVWVTHSLADDRHWAAPVVLPADEARGIAADDISAVVAYEGRVGIMWSDQVEGSMLWASAAAGTDAAGPWTVTTAVKAPAMADDHMSLKALRGDPAGLVVAAIKTSRNDLPGSDPADPLILVLVLQRDGTWTRSVVSTVKQNETRPLLLIDTDHRRLHVLTSAPCCSGGTIYERTASLDDVSFDPGIRRPILRRGRTTALNNAASTKDPLTTESGLLVIASDDNVRAYMHTYEPLARELAPQPSSVPATGVATNKDPGPGPTEEVALEEFETHGLDGWEVTTGSTDSSATVDGESARTDRLGARLGAGPGSDSFAFARLPIPDGELPIGVDLDFVVAREGLADGNVPLLRLLARDGRRIISVYRQNRGTGQIWIGIADQRESTLARVELGAWTHLALTITTDGTTAFASLRIDGRLVGQATLPVSDAELATLQVGNDTGGQPFEIAIDNVRIRR